MAQTQATQARTTRWSLEVARGRDVGKVFELSGGEVVLGNRLDGAVGIDLRDQEAGSPRRMAARQATVEMRGGDLVIRDLDSPGGTFVNRQRLLAGQARRLLAGDEIQLGGVALRVAARESGGQPQQPASYPSAKQPPPVPGGRLPVPYTIGGGVACRTWDDFLVVAAQRWADLRDELASGRLADYLRRIQRTDLLPDLPGRAHGQAGGPNAGPPPLPDGRGPDSDAAILDEPLDNWLGRLPISGSSAPELDVHPANLEVRAAGGTTRHLLQIANVGYRLLRSTARVEPAGADWVKILAPYEGRVFSTIEQTELPVEITAPGVSKGPIDATIVIESNGGTRRIPVRIGQPERPPEWPDPVGFTSGWTLSDGLRAASRRIASVSVPTRLLAGVVLAVAVRSLVAASSLLPFGARGGSLAELHLPALAALCAVIAAIGGLLLGQRSAEGGPPDAVATGAASGLFGILAAAVLYALVRTVERPLGDWSSSPWVVGLLWAAIGAAVAGITGLLVPFHEPSREESA
jgi:hypothetical protein